ncbi:MAG: DNA internalization-related competence protein ComEC/Rec2 [Candidatus Choladocola sp.]|nr:DNA internalization-related competence protein ComEC/Rec2 [Candidatus Choladocola sp.]
MKRPLVWLCTAVILVLSAMNQAGDLHDFPLQSAAALLCDENTKTGRITVCGTVSACSAVSSGIRLSVNHLTLDKSDNSDISLLPELNVTVTTEQKEFVPGDEVRISGTFAEYESASNPGQFDAKAYYDSRKTIGSLSGGRIEKIREGKWSAARILHEIRTALTDSCDRILDEKSARTIEAVTLGEKGRMEREWKSVYQEGGISHILAISGLHITLIGMGIYRLLRKTHFPCILSSSAAAAAVIGYACMTGFGISSVRALLMFLIWLGAQICGRKYDMVTATAVTACLMIQDGTSVLLESSFLLSFGAVLSIAVLVPAVRKFCGISGKVSSAAVSGLTIWMGMLPISLYFFYETSPWSVTVNLAVVALMPALMISGFVSAVLGLFSVDIGTFLAAPVYYLIRLFDFLCGLEQKLPITLWVAGRPSLLHMLMYYGWIILAALFSVRLSGDSSEITGGRNIRTRRLIWFCCGVLCLASIVHPAPEKLEVICMDVGQGDSTLLRMTTGESCLIDGGSSSEKKIWEYTISQVLKYYGVSTLEYVFLSHGDSDHINGIRQFLDEYERGADGRNIHGITVNHLVLPPTADPEDFAELEMLAAKHRIPVLLMERGGSVTGKGWKIDCLAPGQDALTGDRNGDSMVLMLEYGSFRMLFPGDLEGESELQLAASGEDLRCDVLKAGHHGSGGGTSARLLEKTKPDCTVISCGKNNRYGHPAQETVDRILKTGSRIFETKKDGAVMISSDGITFQVDTFGAP